MSLSKVIWLTRGQRFCSACTAPDSHDAIERWLMSGSAGFFAGGGFAAAGVASFSDEADGLEGLRST